MTVVYLSGVWDLFHIGHLNAIREASQLGDKLVIGVITDEFCEEYKGRRPTIPFKQRCAIVSALQYVDAVEPATSFYDFGPMEKHGATLRATRPGFGDYAGQEGVMGEMTTRNYRAIAIPYTPSISTTLIRQRIKGEKHEG